mgnify:CR=1 FL=1
MPAADGQKKKRRSSFADAVTKLEKKSSNCTYVPVDIIEDKVRKRWVAVALLFSMCAEPRVHLPLRTPRRPHGLGPRHLVPNSLRSCRFAPFLAMFLVGGVDTAWDRDDGVPAAPTFPPGRPSTKE